MSDLVTRLSAGRHRVVVSLRPVATLDAFRECVERGYVHVKFTDTQGGTELGIAIDRDNSSLASADFEGGTGQVQIVGRLTLDFVDVRCLAEIDLASLEGLGHLEVVG